MNKTTHPQSRAYLRAPSSAEKKRSRDRKAQQKLRDRREARIRALEEKVAHCESEHGSYGEISDLRSAMNSVQAQNAILLSRQAQLLKLLEACDGSCASAGDGSDTAGNHTSRSTSMRPLAQRIAGDVHTLSEYQPQTLPYGVSTISRHAHVSLSPPAFSPLVPSSIDTNMRIPTDEFCTSPTSPLPLLQGKNLPIPNTRPRRSDIEPQVHGSDSGTSPSESFRSEPRILQAGHPKGRVNSRPDCGPDHEDPWNLLPLNHPDEFTQAWCPWLSCDALLSILPNTASPVDLLFGSKANPVANAICIAFKVLPFADIERLACGWVVYIYTKWRTCPTRETLQNVPLFLHPTRKQLEQSHMGMLDHIIWPDLRDRMIDQITTPSELDEVIHAYGSALRVRWPRSRHALVPDENNILQIDPEFREIISREEGWFLEPDFDRKYPHLTRG